MRHPAVHVCVCVCVTQHKQAQTHLLTSFIHISCFSPCLCREPPFPGVNFFSLQGELKRRWGLHFFFFFLPFSQWWVHAFEEELCHQGISTPCMHPLCSPRRLLHHLSLRERERERTGKRTGFMLTEGDKKKKRQEEKGMLPLPCVHVQPWIKSVLYILINLHPTGVE